MPLTDRPIFGCKEHCTGVVYFAVGRSGGWHDHGPPRERGKRERYGVNTKV